MGLGTVHANVVGELVSLLRVYRVPMLMLLIDGKVVHMNDDITVENVRQFIRQSLPRDLVSEVILVNMQWSLQPDDTCVRSRVLLSCSRSGHRRQLRAVLSKVAGQQQSANSLLRQPTRTVLALSSSRFCKASSILGRLRQHEEVSW